MSRGSGASRSTWLIPPDARRKTEGRPCDALPPLCLDPARIFPGARSSRFNVESSTRNTRLYDSRIAILAIYNVKHNVFFKFYINDESSREICLINLPNLLRFTASWIHSLLLGSARQAPHAQRTTNHWSRWSDHQSSRVQPPLVKRKISTLLRLRTKPQNESAK